MKPLLIGLLLVSGAGAPEIIDRPIEFGSLRERLTLEYRRRHQDPKASGIEIAPKLIVLHHTAIGSLERSFDTLNPEELPPVRPEPVSGDVKSPAGRTGTPRPVRKELAPGGRVNVSAHFLVDRDGTIYRLMPPTRMARHCIGLNHLAIGIENVGGDDAHPLTDAQVDADAWLVRRLVTQFPITHLIGHHEYRRMERHPYFQERQRGYRTSKIDPGAVFMQSVRSRVSDLRLAGPP